VEGAGVRISSVILTGVNSTHSAQLQMFVNGEVNLLPCCRDNSLCKGQ